MISIVLTKSAVPSLRGSASMSPTSFLSSLSEVIPNHSKRTAHLGSEEAWNSSSNLNSTSFLGRPELSGRATASFFLSALGGI
jgi:hypothetical protein